MTISSGDFAAGLPFIAALTSPLSISRTCGSFRHEPCVLPLTMTTAGVAICPPAAVFAGAPFYLVGKVGVNVAEDVAGNEIDV